MRGAPLRRGRRQPLHPRSLHGAGRGRRCSLLRTDGLLHRAVRQGHDDDDDVPQRCSSVAARLFCPAVALLASRGFALPFLRLRLADSGGLSAFRPFGLSGCTPHTTHHRTCRVPRLGPGWAQAAITASTILRDSDKTTYPRRVPLRSNVGFV